jgi:sugar (pentulose or hexulose) kinase
MKTPLVIGIDSSTTACKAIAWDRHGLAVAQGRAAYPLLQPAPNCYEQDAEHWWGGVCTALREMLGQVNAAQIEALCITHQRESCVPVDRQGRPLRNAILWMDERSHQQVEFLAQLIGPDRFHQLTGKPLTANPSVTKIAWLIQHEPQAAARAAKFLDAHALLVHRLTGELVTSLASADPMGLVDIHSHTWATEFMQELGLRVEQFPRLAPPGAVIGRVSESAAAHTGLPFGLPVVAGAGDGQCAGLGAAAIGGARASLNLGTAVVSGVASAAALISRSFRTLYAALPGQYFLETVIQSGGFMVNWFVEQFAPGEALEAAASQVPPGSLGLLVVPYWNHAMTPYWDPAATGITIGWTGAHRREHFYRAILEGIAFEQRLLGAGLMEALGQPLREYVVLGGGSRSDLWCQILADATGVPLVRSTTAEATCLGAGILAATAAGWYADARGAAQHMTDTSRRFTPNPETQGVYERLYQVYEGLFPVLQPLVHRLSESVRSSHNHCYTAGNESFD